MHKTHMMQNIFAHTQVHIDHKNCNIYSINFHIYSIALPLVLVGKIFDEHIVNMFILLKFIFILVGSCSEQNLLGITQTDTHDSK